jgi:multidrug efflux pump subunit AcrB
MAIFIPVAFMTGTIGRFFFQFGVTVSVAVFLSLICALTITPMFCAFFLRVRQHGNSERRGPELGWAVVYSGAVVVLAIFTLIRLLAFWKPIDAWFAWPVLTAVSDLWRFCFSHVPWEQPGLLAQSVRWLLESCAEFGLTVSALRWGPSLFHFLDRYLLGPVLIRPTDWLMAQFTHAYWALLRWSLRVQWLIILAGLLLMAAAGLFIHFDLIGTELVPSEDQSRFQVQIICPVGSSVDYVDQVLQQCEDYLASRSDVAGLLTTVATERGRLINQADIFVRLVPHRERRLGQHAIIDEVRHEFSQMPGMRAVVLDLSTQGFTAQQGFPIDFALQGPDWDKVIEYSDQIIDAMRTSGVVQDIDSDYRPGMPELHVLPDREKCAMVGIPVGTLADTVNALVGGLRVGKFTDRGKRYDVRVRLLAEQRASPLNLPPLALRGAGGKLVQIRDIARFEIVPTLPILNRYNHQRKIEVTANTAQGVSQGEAIRRCQEIVSGILPQGYTAVDLGNAQAMRETMERLVFALVLGIIIAYMILGVQFNSFIHPFTVLLAMPFAATGALGTLWLTGDTLNMMSMIGLILLMGLVKKNSIILVDYTNQLRSIGMPLEEAILTACPIRLRPIVMTSAATVAGAIPAAFGLGPGAETRAPMARGIIGGIILSTLVTLVMVPVFYVVFERIGQAIRRLVLDRPVPVTVPPPARGLA